MAASPVPPKRKGVPLLKAGFGQCRYIISETISAAVCCGASTDGGSWCQEHRARVLVPTSASSASRRRTRADQQSISLQRPTHRVREPVSARADRDDQGGPRSTWTKLFTLHAK
jgi:hypothetical protein